MSRQDLREDIVTVMFTDVEGFTDMTTRRGDAAARRVIDAERKLVREQVGRHGGREIDQIGDGFMVAFTSPRRAVACALAIQDAVTTHNLEHADEGMRIRVGLNIGEVIDEGGHPFGAAVNGAARVAGKAKGGEILVAESVKQLAGTIPDVLFRDRGRFALKGFPDRWRLYEVTPRVPNGEAARLSLPRGIAHPSWRPTRRTGAIAVAVIALGAGIVGAITILRGGGESPPGSEKDLSEPSSIVPGRSIGQARMGMHEADARRAYGEPESTRSWTSRGRSGSTVTYSAREGFLDISYFEGRAVQLSTRSPFYSTEGGIHVGLAVPNPGLPGSNWKEALAEGELIQTGPNEYSWRGFVYGNAYDYCSTGYGTVTMLVLASNTARIESIRITKRDFVLDNLPFGANQSLQGQPPCKHVL
jgi:class 3 adenylate cyclase